MLCAKHFMKLGTDETKSNKTSMASLSRERDAENSPKAVGEESWFVKRAKGEPQACCLNGRARKVKISNRPNNVNNPNWKELNSWIFTKNVGNEFGKIKPAY